VLTVAEIGGQQLERWAEPEVDPAAERRFYYPIHLGVLIFLTTDRKVVRMTGSVE
jgi:hypothetical protein